MTGIPSAPAAVSCFVKEDFFPYRKHHFFGRGYALFPSSSGLGLRRIFSYGSTIKKKYSIATPRISLSPVMEWQECRISTFSISNSSSAAFHQQQPNQTEPIRIIPTRCSSVIEADVPCSVAYECYSNKELIPQWMPFISSVKVLKDKPDLSRWSLKYEVFGRNVEFSWLARNMQPILNQKIHWRSLEGLPNRGAVRFYPRGPTSCKIELTASYEVPEILGPVAATLKPFLEGLLHRGLDRFVTVAKDYQKKALQS